MRQLVSSFVIKIQVSSSAGESKDVKNASWVQKYIEGHRLAFGVLNTNSIKLKSVANKTCQISFSDEKDSHAGLIISRVSTPWHLINVQDEKTSRWEKIANSCNFF